MVALRVIGRRAKMQRRSLLTINPIMTCIVYSRLEARRNFERSLTLFSAFMPTKGESSDGNHVNLGAPRLHTGSLPLRWWFHILFWTDSATWNKGTKTGIRKTWLGFFAWLGMASFFNFASPVDVEVRLDGDESRRQVEVKVDKDRRERCPVYFDGESVKGQVVVRTRDGKRLVHEGIKIEFVGCIGEPGWYRAAKRKVKLTLVPIFLFLLFRAILRPGQSLWIPLALTSARFTWRNSRWWSCFRLWYEECRKGIWELQWDQCQTEVGPTSREIILKKTQYSSVQSLSDTLSEFF